MDFHNKERIDRWIAQTGDRSIVLVIGAGFSRNAIASKKINANPTKIPLWKDIIKTIQEQTGVINGDNLLAFDVFCEYFGRQTYEQTILRAMPDDTLIPGDVHNYLRKIPKIKAIITTNNIDTLLDKTFQYANKIINDNDIPKTEEGRIDLIYLHGHRNAPDSWIFSRTDYDEIDKRFPLKSSLCRVLLSAYPSLFLGFGYSDQDLHSIMRYVTNTVSSYRPPMLALSTSKKNTTLTDYWKKLGLSISVICDNTSAAFSTISSDIVNALHYINENRIKNLIQTGRLSPGFRNDDSFMDELVKEVFDCKSRDGNLFLCNYHETRKRAIIYRELKESDIIPYSPYTSYLEPDGAILSLIGKMNNDSFIPAGSWGLMPSHRKWLTNAIESVDIKENKLKILIIGIAGLPHFVDTVSLIMDCLEDIIEVDITVIDICPGPLKMIADFLNNEYIENDREDCDYFRQVHSYYDNKRLTVKYIESNVFYDTLIENNAYDVILSHHFLSFYDMNVDDTIENYCAFVLRTIKKEGIIVSAQNIAPSEENILAFQNRLYAEGLIPVNMESSFDIYDFNKNNTFDVKKGRFVDNETVLFIHKRGELSDAK